MVTAMKIVCAKCNGVGYITHYEESGVWSEWCETCKGKGTLGDLVVDDIAIAINDEMVYITKKEYNELLEYKDMYERLCK